MKETQQFLAKLGLPAEDNHALQPSGKRFKDGGDYRFEIPSVEGPRVFREVLEAAKELKVPIHRVSQGSGIMLLTKDEIREMARMGAGADGSLLVRWPASAFRDWRPNCIHGR